MLLTDDKSAAQEVRSRILSSQDRFWAVDDFADLDSSAAVASELHRLATANEIEHVRRGLWWRGRKTRFGMSLPGQGAAVRRLVGRREAVGAAEWQATNLLGLSTQIAPVEALAITTRPPTGFRGVRLINRSGRHGRRDHRLNDLEVTILEALEGWDRFVELRAHKAVERFIELLGREDVRLDRLVKASQTESAAVRERLRAVLEAGGWHDEAARVQRARSSSARARALDVLVSTAA
jgi:hypothetical protein